MPFPNGGTPMGLPHRRRDATRDLLPAGETQRGTIKKRLGDVVAEAFVNLSPADYWWSIGFW
ncbi:MAG: hypothetical protein IKX30_11570 [Victivallales bacterium]|nr:hypothetical protein [Victivallales bacterium]